MRRLIRWRGVRRDRGAAAVIVTVLASTGVIIGMLAISADIGAIDVQRRSVQNAADAAVMALGNACAKGATSTCSTGAAPTALSSLVDANSKGATITSVCVSRLGAINADPIADICPTGVTADLGSCLPAPSSIAGGVYVEVRTLNSATTPFGQALGYGSTRPVPACARSAWGAPGSNGGSVPFVFGRCNWDQATSKNTPKFAPSPPYSPAPSSTSPQAMPSGVASYAVPLFGNLNGSEANSALVAKFGCTGDLRNPAGGYTPGGFGWVDTISASNCSALISDGTVVANTGALPNACKSGALKDFVGKEVLIPIISSVTGTGTNAKYTVDGVSSFFLAGYNNVSAAQPQDIAVYTGGPCVGYKSECVWGWFTSPLLPLSTGTGGTGTPRGPVSVWPAG